MCTSLSYIVYRFYRFSIGLHEWYRLYIGFDRSYIGVDGHYVGSYEFIQVLIGFI